MDPKTEPAQQHDPATQYRFVGSDTEVTHLGKRFLNFGEKVIIPGGEKEATDIGGPFITEADWQAVGISDDEQERWSNPADHEYFDESGNLVQNAPVEFLAKKKAALGKLHESVNKPPAPSSDPVVRYGLTEHQPEEGVI